MRVSGAALGSVAVSSATQTTSVTYTIGTRAAPGRKGPFDPRGFLLRQKFDYTPAPVAGTLFFQSVDGTITPIGDLIKMTTRPLSGGITPIGDLVKQTIKILTGGITPVGTLVKQTIKFLVGGITPAGSLSRQTNIPLDGGITPNGTEVGSKITLSSLSGAITPTGALDTLKQLTQAATDFIHRWWHGFWG